MMGVFGYTPSRNKILDYTLPTAMSSMALLIPKPTIQKKNYISAVVEPFQFPVNESFQFNILYWSIDLCYINRSFRFGYVCWYHWLLEWRVSTRFGEAFHTFNVHQTPKIIENSWKKWMMKPRGFKRPGISCSDWLSFKVDGLTLKDLSRQTIVSRLNRSQGVMLVLRWELIVNSWPFDSWLAPGVSLVSSLWPPTAASSFRLWLPLTLTNRSLIRSTICR